MKVNRLVEMSELEKAIVLMIWSDVKDLPLYANWRNYERGFTHENKNYRYKCRFKVEDGHLRLMDAVIEHERVTIDLMH
jgi:hypothetical protein